MDFGKAISSWKSVSGTRLDLSKELHHMQIFASDELAGTEFILAWPGLRLEPCSHSHRRLHICPLVSISGEGTLGYWAPRYPAGAVGTKREKALPLQDGRASFVEIIPLTSELIPCESWPARFR